MAKTPGRQFNYPAGRQPAADKAAAPAKPARSRKGQPKLKKAEQAELENKFAYQLQTSGLLQHFTRNYRGAVPGTNFELDFADLKHRIGIEIQGGTWVASKMGHNSGSGIRRDCIKANRLQLNGWYIFKFTSDMVRDLSALEFMEVFYKSHVQRKAAPDVTLGQLL